MQAPAAAKGHVRKLTGVMTLFNGDHAHSTSHLGIGHRQNGFRRFHSAQAQRLSHMLLNGLLRQICAQGLQQAATQRTVCSDATQKHIGIGHSWSCVATVVARRAGHTAGRLGAYLQHATGVHRCNGAATRTNGFNLNHGRAHDQAKFDGCLGCQRRLTLRYQRHIKRSTPHVAGHHIGEPGCARNGRTGHHACSRARQGRANRDIACRLTRHHAAIALHNQQFACKALATQIRFQARQIAAHHGLQCRIQGGGGAALKLSNFGQDLAGCSDVGVGPHGADSGHGGLLVGHVGIGIDEKHAHSFATRIEQHLRLCFDLIDVHWRVDLAIGQHALIHLQAQSTWHDGRETTAQTPGLWPVTPAHFEHVTETACGDDASACDFAL